MNQKMNEIRTSVTKWVIFLLVLFTLSFAVGCSSRDKGENMNWTAEYKGQTVDEFYMDNGILKCKENADGKLVFTYKKELSELSTTKEIGFNFIKNGGNISFEQATDKKIFSWDIGITGAVAIEESVNLEIVMDGKTETIVMKNMG